MPGKEGLRRPNQQPHVLDGARCRKRSDSHTTSNLDRFLLAVRASFLTEKTELFNYYLSSNKTKLKSLVLDLVCFTGSNHLVTVKLLVYIVCKHHPVLFSCGSALCCNTVTNVKRYPCVGSPTITDQREDRSSSHCKLSALFRYGFLKNS